MSFNTGSAVQLKSGGVKMTVEAVEGGSIKCIWSDGKRIFRDTFIPDVLTSYATFEDLLDEIDGQEGQKE